MTCLPRPRGALSEALTAVLTGPVGDRIEDLPAAEHHADEALSLWLLHELHYRGLPGLDGHPVDERWEWHPDLMRVRWHLEGALEERLRKDMPAVPHTGDVVADVVALIATHDGPSLARHLQRGATRDQALELLRQRSVYHLKEADPTSWVIPRLAGGTAKAALLEIQFDEYGNGDPARLHHTMFARGMAACGLRTEPAAYVDEALTEVLEQNNAVSMFGLHRRLRGAALGHFAAFEATSSLPSRQVAQGLDRLGLPAEIIAYYDEHVEADAVHEHLALRDVCGTLVAEEPDLAEDVLFGAWACLELETRTATAMLERWGVA